MIDFIKLLSDEGAVDTEFHKTLLQKCKSLVDMSRRYMQAQYNQWDRNFDVFRGIRALDKNDTEALSRKEPDKMVVPLTFAQVQTFVSFCLSLFTQRERMFELVGTGEEDHKAAKLAEALIARDLTVNVFEAKLDQFLTDIAVFGLGVVKNAWVREQHEEMVTEQDAGPLVDGQPVFSQPTAITVRRPVTTYLGNRIVNVSPYSFFPDVRLPLSRFQEGEFVASEDVYNISQLYQWQYEGRVAGVEWVKPYKADTDVERYRKNHLSRSLEHATASGSVVGKTDDTLGTVVVTEVQLVIIPKMFSYEEDGKTVFPFGEGTVPEKWLVWYCNDNRIINVEPYDFDHRQFSYSLAEFSPNMHTLINQALADMIDKLQDVTSWLINTHITNVRKVIGDKLIVDPSGVMMEDLKERRPVIRLSKNATGQGVDKFVKQLAVNDVTSRHMEDANELHGLVQVTTGINDNALGQYYTGRRTATESRNANTGAAARLKKVALLIFRTGLEPLARQMVSNHKQGLDVETYVQVAGELADMQDYQRFVLVTRNDIRGSYDFEIFDGTLPSERQVQAQAIEEFLIQLMGNPQVVLMLGYDPVKLIEEWLELRGIRNPKRFMLNEVRAQQLVVQLQASGLLNAAEVVGAGQPGVPGQQGGLPVGRPQNAGRTGGSEGE